MAVAAWHNNNYYSHSISGGTQVSIQTYQYLMSILVVDVSSVNSTTITFTGINNWARAMVIVG